MTSSYSCWTCHLKLGLRPSFILNNKLWLFLDLDDGALDLSLMTNYDCFRTWMMGHWTWSFQVAPSVSCVMKNYDRFWTWMLGHWTCHFEAGPSPSFILNAKLWLFADLDDGPDGALDLSFWRRSFSFMRNDKLCLFPDLDSKLILQLQS